MSYCFDLAKKRLRTVSSDPAWSDLETFLFEQLHLAPEQSWEFFICLDLGMESSYVLLEMERSWKIIRNKFFGLLKMDLVADVLNC
ncbi:unnamed protein product [Rhizophagus irregularis]|nr:unnamed protein product [Rhizophagus irregularis]